MEDHRRRFYALMSLYVPRLQTNHDKRCVHVLFDGALPWVCINEEDIGTALDLESELVRQLMRQVTTYEFLSESVVGMIVDRRIVLSEVVRL